MQKENIFIRGLGLVALIGAIVLTALLLVWNTQRVQGSVEFQGSGYLATTTGNMSAGDVYVEKTLKTGSGILGSVVVTLGSNSRLELYDATSTRTDTRYSTTSLAVFKTTATAGTYTFDVQFNRGLLVVIPVSVGAASSTVTWK